MNRFQLSLLVLLAWAMTAWTAHAGTTVATAMEVLEAAVERAALVSNRPVLTAAAKKVAVEELKQAANKQGPEVIKLVEEGGMEMLEAIPKHGSEIMAVASKASPQARRALALNATELLPLATRVGADALELEAKVPGQAGNVFKMFGDQAGVVVARQVPAADLPRMIKYAERADSPATRELLLQAYEKEGASIFTRIPPKLVLASGLSASMVLGTHEAMATERAKADVLRDNPEIARDVMNWSTSVGGVVVLVIIVLLLWRFGLMPWHRRRTTGK